MLKKNGLFLVIFLCYTFMSLHAQHTHESEDTPLNRLVFSGFGELHYNQPTGKNPLHNGKLDIHRLVVGMGYRFNHNFSFMTEVAYEHVSEVLIEQMYLNYKKNDAFQIKTGLLPVPMGIVNQEHEPNHFNGVEHPALNEHIIPTAWREIGVGIHGEFEKAGLHYQLYMLNGFSTYKDDEGLASGHEAFRAARQEGVESFISHPNFTGRLAYEKINGLVLGASFYFGKTQSDLYDTHPKALADSSVVGLTMGGLDARYKINNLHLRGEYVYTKISNVKEYNEFTHQDLGKAFMGYYGEIAYDFEKNKQSVTPFFRYGKYDTHYEVESDMEKNTRYNKTYYTLGITYRPISRILLKADYQWINDAAKNKYNMFNIGANFVF